MQRDPTSQPSSASELQKLRMALLKSLPEIYPKSAARMVADALADPLFPFTFLLRNVVVLHTESNWRRLPPAAKKTALLRLLRERSSIFCRVKDWLGQKMEEPGLFEAPLADPGKGAEQLGYCIHCGGCCEIASGLPDFPAGVEIPSAWMRLFGAGLGPYHRFCPFLWEANGEGLSLCAIHAWRPNPCRLFAEEECRFLLADPDFKALRNPAALVHAGSSLAACFVENPATERAFTAENAENQ